MSDSAISAGPGSSLSAAVQLLDSFAVRHHNQHRASKWWGRFDMLRRSGRKLLTALEASGGAPLDEAVQHRARWLRDHIMPAAYACGFPPSPTFRSRPLGVRSLRTSRSFTQLTADNTFAPLGLFLIGVLARFNSVLAELLPPQGASPPIIGGPNTGMSSLHAPAPQDGSGDVDVGVSISRDESQPAGSSAVGRLSGAEEDAVGIDETAARGGRASTTMSSERSRPGRKKKKRRRDGDEFTDLFSSLV